jgi:hypothetical protein
MSQIEITPALLSDLRQKAEAATPGPWKVIETPRPDYSEDLRIVPCDAYGNSRGDGPIGDVFGGYKRPVAENAAHIAAASPAVVLALVAEVERLRDRLDDLVCSGCDQQPKFCSCEVVPLSGSDQRG